MDPLENLQKTNEILNYENIKKLDDFLSIFKVEKGNQYSHTTMGKKAGSYFIPDEYLDKFYELYNRELIWMKKIENIQKHILLKF